MERTLAPRRPWLTVVAFLLLVVVVGIAAKSMLPRSVEPEEAEHGFSGSGFNEPIGGEKSPFAPIVELAPGRNEFVLPRRR